MKPILEIQPNGSFKRMPWKVWVENDKRFEEVKTIAATSAEAAAEIYMQDAFEHAPFEGRIPALVQDVDGKICTVKVAVGFDAYFVGTLQK